MNTTAALVHTEALCKPKPSFLGINAQVCACWAVQQLSGCVWMITLAAGWGRKRGSREEAGGSQEGCRCPGGRG